MFYCFKTLKKLFFNDGPLNEALTILAQANKKQIKNIERAILNKYYSENNKISDYKMDILFS